MALIQAGGLTKVRQLDDLEANLQAAVCRDDLLSIRGGVVGGYGTHRIEISGIGNLAIRGLLRLSSDHGTRITVSVWEA